MNVASAPYTTSFVCISLCSKGQSCPSSCICFGRVIINGVLLKSVPRNVQLFDVKQCIVVTGTVRLMEDLPVLDTLDLKGVECTHLLPEIWNSTIRVILHDYQVITLPTTLVEERTSLRRRYSTTLEPSSSDKEMYTSTPIERTLPTTLMVERTTSGRTLETSPSLALTSDKGVYTSSPIGNISITVPYENVNGTSTPGGDGDGLTIHLSIGAGVVAAVVYFKSGA